MPGGWDTGNGGELGDGDWTEYRHLHLHAHLLHPFPRPFPHFRPPLLSGLYVNPVSFVFCLLVDFPVISNMYFVISRSFVYRPSQFC